MTSEFAEVENIYAPGWGTTMYLAMMQYFKLLKPCSVAGKVSDGASKVWKKIANNSCIHRIPIDGRHEQNHLNAIYWIADNYFDLDKSIKIFNEDFVGFNTKESAKTAKINNESQLLLVAPKAWIRREAFEYVVPPY